MGKVFNTNYSILFIRNTSALYLRKEEKYVIDEKYQKDTYHLVIFIINFREANTDLIKQVVQLKFEENFIPIPKQMTFFKIEQQNSEYYKNEYEKFYTKKNEDYLPSLIFVFTEEDLCLYGFPFSLLENAEIIKSGNLSRFSILDYLRHFEKYNKIDKRFGK